jgi:hypothetical protein
LERKLISALGIKTDRSFSERLDLFHFVWRALAARFLRRLPIFRFCFDGVVYEDG